MIIKIKTLSEFDVFLSSIETKTYNLINYVWIEYGYYPIIFNELFHSFYHETKGKKIGVCFPGHEVFYKPHVDILIVLENFINTELAYVNNKETNLLISNFKTQPDKGIAFWYTIRNFDENEYKQIIDKYIFRNQISPIGNVTPWEHNLFRLPKGFKYGYGDDGEWCFPETQWYTEGNLGWDISKWNRNFEKKRFFNLKKFNTFFVKNTWKSRNYNSGNLDDLLVGDDGTSGSKGWGYTDYEFYLKVINYHIDNKMDLVIINDLVSFPKIQNEFIHYLNMVGHFDTELFLTTIDDSETFISVATSPVDLASYYCNTNIVLLDDYSKLSFIDKVQKLKGKSCMSYFINDDINNLFEFIKWT